MILMAKRFSTIKSAILKKSSSQDGQGLVEYTLLLGLFAVVVLMIFAVILNKGFGGAFNFYKAIFMIPYPSC